MASSTPLTDLAENFFMCSVCLDQFKEPKRLPCLHRYCRNCLKALIQGNYDGKLNCPLCKQEYVIPEGGVDDFKTDFHMKSVLALIQLQKSFENKELKKCVSCLKNKKASAYCFKCRDYLCEQCYKVHVTSRMFTDHKTHILSLDKMEAKNMTLDKLTSLTEDPRCHIHDKKEAQLCCSSCGNVPVCMICTYNKHKGHDLHDVTEIAERERKLLKQEHAELNKFQDKLYGLLTKIQSTKQKLHENAEKRTERLINQHKQQADRIKDKIAECTKERKRGLEDIECRRRVNDGQITLNLEKGSREVRKKYDKFRKTANQGDDKESEEFINKCDKTESELDEKLRSLDANLKNLTTAKDLLVNRNEDELKQIREYCEQVIKRYENVKATTSSVIASKDDWTDAQCIPDIRAACEPLMVEMKKEYPELESLSDFVICEITKFNIEVTIAQHQESGIKVKGWHITDITSRGDVKIVITHNPLEEYSHITVFNRKGEIQRQDQIIIGIDIPICGLLSESKAVTWEYWYGFGIYDVRDGTYSKKNIRDIITRWSSVQYVSCVTTDPVKNHIIVGTNRRNVYVYTDQMNYSHMITLPAVIDASDDITVHRDSLLVCDNSRGRSYAVTIEESQSKLIYEFTKPDLDGLDWNPTSVCTDKNEFIYMLWQTATSYQRRPILVQYSQDGRQLLTTRIVNHNVYRVSTLEENGTEKLLMTTTVGSFHTFDLVVT
ncbi:hypothetical protein BSL78_15197 [Apostichopus japonicus]|uniref:Uncharacterized protein n=1 Tax=Stichopus japonicus TaxID=307972 RepID=A0A2G8KIX5_STIJA|nr:hypothetical protein BSL78_15197 [Apostichopus japonicus]